MRQLSDTTWVLEGPCNIGFIVNDDEVTLIDSGNDKEAGRKISKILKEKNWELKNIINTHSNADHIGGNNYLQNMTNCNIYTSEIEDAFIQYPELEKAFLWGGFEINELRNKFFYAKKSKVTNILRVNEEFQNDLEIISLKGHFLNMIGIITKDNDVFLADSVFGENIIDKYGLPFIYDVKEFISTLKKIEKLNARYYIPSHGQITDNIKPLVIKNIEVVEKAKQQIKKIISSRKTFETILKEYCDINRIVLNGGQYALVGSTIRSMLTYLADGNEIEYIFDTNQMLWKTITV
ncbi:MBL fold metallo-hydrolase [Marispirochaeta aestuarii]|uniref:MBL fold metallo-hydrolase n=1 Tax=Marispirochaeta aestuarii TaxID=1963862 RepID=UPI0029C93F33|nr:MBL fold metallo-hydrolase [Marispirochaeta aestuarii]